MLIVVSFMCTLTKQYINFTSFQFKKRVAVEKKNYTFSLGSGCVRHLLASTQFVSHQSSVCYNPFIYSIRNSYFRRVIKNFFLFIFCRYNKTQNSSSRLRDVSNTQMTSFRFNSTRVKQQYVVDSADEVDRLKVNALKSQNENSEKDSNKWLIDKQQ